jgi:hypothetical protein
MSQREIAITGKNNTKAAVTGQEELLVRVNSVSSTTALARRAGIIRPTAAGDVNFYAAEFYSVSVANTGLADGGVLGTEVIRPGEILNFSADSLNNYFTSFAYDATGTNFLITFVY